MTGRQPLAARGAARHRVAVTLERSWQSRGALVMALYPLSLVYRLLMALRRILYRRGILSSERAGCPVVVVGNVTVGGNGKTPFTAWLATWLARRGFTPGIVLRGYRGESDRWPIEVTAQMPAATAGDEAVLLAQTTGLPVAAGPDRIAACRLLIERHRCDVILSDDGLQHLALARDFEIVLHDPAGQGNGWCLPAGPLREPLTRLADADLVVPYGDTAHGVAAHTTSARPLDGAGETRALEGFRGQRLLALTAIARPGRFFDSLSAHGLEFDRLALPDHHALSARDIPDSPYDAILVTGKDAVKLADFHDPRFQVVTLELDVSSTIIKHLERSLLPRLRPEWSNSTS